MTHTFKCDCGNIITDINTKKVHVCSCGCDMYWDLKCNGIRAGDYHHISDALAFHPDDIPEHRKLFPDVEVTPEGRPMFTSPKQQERYANRCSFDKKPQKIKPRGKRIA